MSFRTVPIALALVLLVGCQPPPEAPTDLSDLSLYLFANFDDEDPLVLQAGVVNLLAFLEDFVGKWVVRDLAKAAGERYLPSLERRPSGVTFSAGTFRSRSPAVGLRGGRAARLAAARLPA